MKNPILDKIHVTDQLKKGRSNMASVRTTVRRVLCTLEGLHSYAKANKMNNECVEIKAYISQCKAILDIVSSV